VAVASVAMDLRRLVALLMVLLVVQLGLVSFSLGNVVFKVQHKFAGRLRNLTEFKAHDARRHSRLLSSVDLPLGGNGHPAETGFVFTFLFCINHFLLALLFFFFFFFLYYVYVCIAMIIIIWY
jgi:hypothetical protein